MGELAFDTPTVSSKDLIGAIVKSSEGDELGEIEELVVNSENGCVSNLIVATKALLGKKRIAIPFDMLAIDAEAHAFILNMDKDFLRRIPAYHGGR